MLHDRCPVCLSVTLVYCGQTVGWIKMPLGTEVGLSPGDIVLDRDPASLTETGTVLALPSFRLMSIVAKRSPISATAKLFLYYRTWYFTVVYWHLCAASCPPRVCRWIKKGWNQWVIFVDWSQSLLPSVHWRCRLCDCVCIDCVKTCSDYTRRYRLGTWPDLD